MAVSEKIRFHKKSQPVREIFLVICLILITIGIVLTLTQQGSPTTTRTTAAGKFVKSRVVDGAGSLTAMAFAPDGRLFLIEKNGNVRVSKNGQLLPTPFLKLSNINSAGERGLLGIAFDPNFQQNKYLYLYYTVGSPLHNRVSRFTANGDVVVPNSEKILLDLPGLNASNHNGGAIHFGSDGKLYIGVGDNAVASNARSMTTTLGKILRINPDGTLPADNPFYATTTGSNRAIWAYGLRNPFTFAIQPGTNKMFVNDVGDNGAKRWEEINDVKRGGNYGWPNAWGLLGAASGEKPVYTYQDGGCAVTGGTFYNPSVASFPTEYVGHYFFADYCGGWIRIINPTTKVVREFQKGFTSPVDLQVGPDGALYVLSTAGHIEKIAYVDEGGQKSSIAPSQQPGTDGQQTLPNAPKGTISAPANKVKYNAGQTFTFTGTATDPQDGTLPASAFSWTIVFHHATHTHPFLGPIMNSKSGTFTIPQTGEWASDVWYRVNLTVKDSSGLTHTSFVDVIPNTVKLTLQTVPPGIPVAFDSVPDTAPYTEATVVGMKRTISVPLNQTLNGKNYTFQAWSDKKTRTHEIIAPAQDTTYTAQFTEGTNTNGNNNTNDSNFTIIGDCIANNNCPDKTNQPGGNGEQQTDPQKQDDAQTDNKGLLVALLGLLQAMLSLLLQLIR